MTNGEAKPAPKKRGRWDQTSEGETTPAKKTKLPTDSSPWDKEDVSVSFITWRRGFTLSDARSWLLSLLVVTLGEKLQSSNLIS